MAKNFELRRSNYCADLYLSGTDYFPIIETIRVPNINTKQMVQIVMFPESNLELTLAKKIVQIASIISENMKNCTFCTDFKPLESDGYLYFDYATSLFYEEFNSIFVDNKEITIGKFSEGHDKLRKLVFGVANDARNISTEKYHKLCSEVNILNNPYFYDGIISSLCNKKESLDFRVKRNFQNVNGEFTRFIASHVEGLSNILFLGENNNDYANKTELSEQVINQAIQFAQTYEEYIKSLSKSSSRN